MTAAPIVRADAIAIPRRDECVDLIVTSPPYFALRSYRDGGEHYDGQIGSEPTPRDFLRALWAVTAECQRVLKPTGSMFVNLGDKYAGSGGHNNSGISDKTTLTGGTRKLKDDKARHQATRRSAPDRYNQSSVVTEPMHHGNGVGRQMVPGRTKGYDGIRAKSLMGLPWRYAIGCIDGEAGEPLILRRDLVWSKPNGLPESVTDRCRSSHEYWFHLTKEGRYFSALDELREPYAIGTAERYVHGYSAASHNGMERSILAGDSEPEATNPLGKLPGSVWTIPTEPLVGIPEELGDHFAAFPQEWPRRLILGWTPNGICLECDEGRRPVTEVNLVGGSPFAGRDYRRLANGPNGGTERPMPGGHNSATITGYACACPEPTAPTRPAVVLDPFAGTGTTIGAARALGRVAWGWTSATTTAASPSGASSAAGTSPRRPAGPTATAKACCCDQRVLRVRAP